MARTMTSQLPVGGFPDCPRCGSTLARRIAPTLVECQAVLTERIVVGMQPIIRPGPVMGTMTPMGLAPIFEDRAFVCRDRHHVGMALIDWPECECGTFAIGRCKTCSTPVCGDDSVRLAGERVCKACERSALIQKSRASGDPATDYSTPWPDPCKGGHKPSYAPNGRCWICYPRYR